MKGRIFNVYSKTLQIEVPENILIAVGFEQNILMAAEFGSGADASAW